MISKRPPDQYSPHRTTTPRRRRGPLTLTSPSVHDLRDTKKACQTLSIALFRQRRRSQYRCTSHTVAGGRPDGRGRPAPELRLVSHLQSPPLLHSFLSQPYPVSVPVRVAIRTPCPGPLLRSGGNADIVTTQSVCNWCSRHGTTNPRRHQGPTDTHIILPVNLLFMAHRRLLPMTVLTLTRSRCQHRQPGPDSQAQTYPPLDVRPLCP